MRRTSSKAQAMAGLALVGFLLLGGGCAASGVGDPCVPEAVPPNGFTPNEVYVESSAVQCRTRTCLVYHLTGDPENLMSNGCPDGGTGCVDDINPVIPGTELAPNSINRVFCSCRCRPDATAPNLPTCSCGDGYNCSEEGFCVPHEADPGYCSETYESNCTADACDLATNRCP